MTDITNKQMPFGQYEFVDVTFDIAGVDVAVPYEQLRVDDRQKIRWIDVSQSALMDGTIPRIYRGAKPFNAQSIFLRSNSAGYATRLLLFVERT